MKTQNLPEQPRRRRLLSPIRRIFGRKTVVSGGTAPLSSNKLAGQPLGQRLKISSFSLPDGARLRLLEMGLTQGIECTVVRYAPLGDPMEVKVREYFLSLRASEAEGVLVEAAE